MKELPKVFASKVEKDTNRSVAYTPKEEIIPEKKIELPGQTIPQKISQIFSSTDYIYKAEVGIKMNGETVYKKIIGKNKDNLITMDNEVIPISKIEDIWKK